MEDRGPFRFLVAAVSGQSYQREQGHWERAPAHQQQADHRFKDGGQQLALSDTYLGAQFRRFRTKLGAPVAIKFARLWRSGNLTSFRPWGSRMLSFMSTLRRTVFLSESWNTHK
jgi:hypothetical protein